MSHVFKLAFVAGILLRVVLLVFTDLPSLASDRVEVSTPVTSFKRLQEGLFLYQHGVAPYEGGVYYQAPILLTFFNHIPSVLTPYVFIGLDILIAVFIIGIAKYKRDLQAKEVWPETGGLPIVVSSESKDCVQKGKSAESKSKEEKGDPTKPQDSPILPLAIGVVYLFTPYSVLACLAQSTQLFSHVASAAGLYFAVQGNRFLSIPCLALASYFSLYPIMLVIPAVLFIAQSKNAKFLPLLFSSSILFVTFELVLLVISHQIVGSWQFLESTYGVIIFVPDLTPNIGLYWYFFIEMFDQFRTFFLLVFQIHVFIFVAPLAIRFKDHPMFITLAMTMIMAIFKSYPSVADLAFYIPFLLMHQELFKYMRNLFFVCNCLAYATVLSPLFYNLWIYAGSGNANFFYAITLVIGLSQVILAIDVTYAMVRREWERLNPEMRKAWLEIYHK